MYMHISRACLKLIFFIEELEAIKKKTDPSTSTIVSFLRHNYIMNIHANINDMKTLKICSIITRF